MTLHWMLSSVNGSQKFKMVAGHPSTCLYVCQLHKIHMRISTSRQDQQKSNGYTMLFRSRNSKTLFWILLDVTEDMGIASFLNKLFGFQKQLFTKLININLAFSLVAFQQLLLSFWGSLTSQQSRITHMKKVLSVTGRIPWLHVTKGKWPSLTMDSEGHCNPQNSCDNISFKCFELYQLLLLWS